MNDFRAIPFRIETQGAPVISDQNAIVFAEAPNILCLDVDLDSKWCKLDGTGGGDGSIYVEVGVTPWTIHPDEGPGHPDPDSATGIMFDNMAGWTLYNAEVARYTLRITLIKDAP